MVVWWVPQVWSQALDSMEWNNLVFLKPQSHLTKMNSQESHSAPAVPKPSPRHRIHDVVGNDQAHQCQNTSRWSKGPERFGFFISHVEIPKSLQHVWKFCRKRRFIGCRTTETLRYFPKVFFTEEPPKNYATISPVSGEVLLVMDAIIISP